MKYIAAVGSEVRFQARREGVGRYGPYVQEEGEVILMHFLSGKSELFSAHIGRRFSTDENLLPALEDALEDFPIDGGDLPVVDGLVYPRGADPELGARGHRLRPAHLWTPTRDESMKATKLEGYAVGYGCTIEYGRRGWFLLPYLTVRVDTDRGPRNVHARLFPPFHKANLIANLAHIFRKDGGPGELPEYFSTLHSRWKDTHLLGECAIHAERGVYLWDHFFVEEVTEEPAAPESTALSTALAVAGMAEATA